MEWWTYILIALPIARIIAIGWAKHVAREDREMMEDQRRMRERLP